MATSFAMPRQRLTEEALGCVDLFLGNWRGTLHKFAFELELGLDGPIPPRHGPSGYAFDNSIGNRATPNDLRILIGATGFADKLGFSIPIKNGVGTGKIAASLDALCRHELALREQKPVFRDRRLACRNSAGEFQTVQDAGSLVPNMLKC